MLLTDGSPNNTEDLRVYESAILGLANLETIDLGVKLDLATEEISEEVLDFLLDHASTNLQVFSPFQTGTPAARRRTIGVSDVVVSRQLSGGMHCTRLKSSTGMPSITSSMTAIRRSFWSTRCCRGTRGSATFVSAWAWR